MLLDPDRFHTPGRLLEEEKIRNDLQKRKIALEEGIRHEIGRWQFVNKQRFFYQGRDYLKQLELESKRAEVLKQQKKASR